MHIRVEEYIRPDGSSPYADWFNGLDAQAAAKRRQQADIERAKTLHAEYKARKAAARAAKSERPKR